MPFVRSCIRMALGLLLLPSLVLAGDLEQGIKATENGEFDLAVTLISKHLRENPKDVEGYLQRARAYELDEKYDKAVADCTEAVRLDSKNVAAFLARENAYEWTHRNWELRHADSSDRRANIMQYPKSLLIKMGKVNKLLPQWIEKEGIFKAMDDYEKLQNADREDRWKEAEDAADAILKSMESEDCGE